MALSIDDIPEEDRRAFEIISEAMNRVITQSFNENIPLPVLMNLLVYSGSAMSYTYGMPRNRIVDTVKRGIKSAIAKQKQDREEKTLHA